MTKILLRFCFNASFWRCIASSDEICCVLSCANSVTKGQYLQCFLNLRHLVSKYYAIYDTFVDIASRILVKTHYASVM